MHNAMFKIFKSSITYAVCYPLRKHDHRKNVKNTDMIFDHNNRTNYINNDNNNKKIKRVNAIGNTIKQSSRF